MNIRQQMAMKAQQLQQGQRAPQRGPTPNDAIVNILTKLEMMHLSEMSEVTSQTRTTLNELAQIANGLLGWIDKNHEGLKLESDPRSLEVNELRERLNMVFGFVPPETADDDS